MPCVKHFPFLDALGVRFVALLEKGTNTHDYDVNWHISMSEPFRFVRPKSSFVFLLRSATNLFEKLKETKILT